MRKVELLPNRNCEAGYGPACLYRVLEASGTQNKSDAFYAILDLGMSTCFPEKKKEKGSLQWQELDNPLCEEFDRKASNSFYFWQWSRMA